MHQQHLAGREVRQQVFRAPADAVDGLPFEPLVRSSSGTESADPAAAPRPARSARLPSRAAARGARFRLREARAWLTSRPHPEEPAEALARRASRRMAAYAGVCGHPSRRVLRTLLRMRIAMRYVAPPWPTRYVCSMRDETHFGSRTVPLDEKQALVDDVFHKVARRYDLMNDLMSAGLHRAWKDALVTAINPPRGDQDFKLLDVAGGTGDISFRTVDAGGTGTRATVGRHQCRDARRRARAGVRARARRRGDLRRRECRGAAVPGQELRRRLDRVRHPQRAAHRRRAEGNASRAAARRALPVPGILQCRRAGARCALRALFVQRRAGDRPRGRRRRRALSLSRRVDPPLPAARTRSPT